LTAGRIPLHNASSHGNQPNFLAGAPVSSRQRAADDFATIRARMEELRRERDGGSGDADPAPPPTRRGTGELERRRRIEGWPPPWAPTIFVRRPRR
jgi:hypothetical protein